LQGQTGVVAFACQDVEPAIIRTLASLPAHSPLTVLWIGPTPGQRSIGANWETVAEKDAPTVAQAFRVQIQPVYYVSGPDGIIRAAERTAEGAMAALTKVLAGKK
jgi:hypothetical protein